MSRRPVVADGDGVRLAGWVEGDGLPVLLLHGGPGLSYDYLDGMAADLGDGYLVASYQQRGLSPSSEDGPFRVADHVSDVRLVLDALGWERAVLLGHSWGGHLALHAAVALPERVGGVLAVDTFGAVGDGGSEEFEAAVLARTPEADRQRLAEIEALEERGEATAEHGLESLRLIWPAYFATREAAPPMPEIRLGGPCYLETMESASRELPALEAALPGITTPVGFLRGAGSPMPAAASTAAADRIEGAWVESLEGAGHFVWLDRPGCVRAAVDRLVRRGETGSWPRPGAG